MTDHQNPTDAVAAFRAAGGTDEQLLILARAVAEGTWMFEDLRLFLTELERAGVRVQFSIQPGAAQ